MALKTNKAAGPDRINGRVFREVADQITEPLNIIYNKSPQEKLPDDWRTAVVVPIFNEMARAIVLTSREETVRNRKISPVDRCTYD
jgi:hypothetical protein